jgi:acetyl esterase/lipase
MKRKLRLVISVCRILAVLMLSANCSKNDTTQVIFAGDEKENMSASVVTVAANERHYPKITADDLIVDLFKHPAFEGRGRLLFPWDSDSRYNATMTLRDAGSLHLWHTNMETDEMVTGVNRMIDDINAGKKVLYDFYTKEDKAADPTKVNTGLFFFRGIPGAPFAVVSAGGGFVYVGSLHEGFPLAMEINKRGYNAFVLKYRVGQGEKISSLDLIAAVRFIEEHANELDVDPNNYSLWGGSAGARISSNVSYGEGGIARDDVLHPATVMIAYATHPGNPDFTADDPAGFFMVGTEDWIVPVKHVETRAAAMRDAGIKVECIVYKGIGHGYGVGKGTIAEGWMDKAIDFWEENMDDR